MQRLCGCKFDLGKPDADGKNEDCDDKELQELFERLAESGEIPG